MTSRGSCARSSSPSGDAGRRPRTRSSARCSSATARSWARAGTSGPAARMRRSPRSGGGERAGGATLYVTLEPCAHTGERRPARMRSSRPEFARVVAAVGDPNPLTTAPASNGSEPQGRGRARGRRARVAGARPERGLPRLGRRGSAVRRLQGGGHARRTRHRPGSRWVTGEASRRRVHELRARVDAVAVGMGTVRADDPQLTARDVGAERQPRRLAFGQGPLPEGPSWSCSRARSRRSWRISQSGSGLGLAIVREQAALVGAEVVASSIEGGAAASPSDSGWTASPPNRSSDRRRPATLRRPWRADDDPVVRVVMGCVSSRPDRPNDRVLGRV